MSRWSKHDDRDQPPIEQFQLKLEEETIKWAKRRERGEDIDSIPVRPRKLSPVEVRYLEMLEDRRALEAELADW